MNLSPYRPMGSIGPLRQTPPAGGNPFALPNALPQGTFQANRRFDTDTPQTLESHLGRAFDSLNLAQRDVLRSAAPGSPDFVMGLFKMQQIRIWIEALLTLIRNQFAMMRKVIDLLGSTPPAH